MLRLTLLTAAERDQDHIPAILWSDPRVPDRNAARRGTGPDPLPWLVRGLHGLEAAGCGAVAIPCNTAHGWIDGMRAATKLPILHIIDAAADDLRRQEIGAGADRRHGHRGDPGDAAIPGSARRAGLADHSAERGRDGPPGHPGDRMRSRQTASPKPTRRSPKPLPCSATAAPAPSFWAAPRSRSASRPGLGKTLDIPLVDTIDALARASIDWARG